MSDRLCCNCKNAKYGVGGWYCNYYNWWVEGTHDGWRCAGWKSESSSSSGGCFLTSACVKHLGKPDNCDELQTLRAFRDGYMSKTEEGLSLIKQYYAVAPQIVEKIDASNETARYYDSIYATVCKCVELIKQDKFDETLQEYKNMVLSLQKEFGLA